MDCGDLVLRGPNPEGVAVMRTLVVQVPDCVCIGCQAKMPGAVRNMYAQTDDGSRLRAYFDPPKGWVRLEPRQASMPEQMPLRSFFLCGTCYTKGEENYTNGVDALYEARDK